MTSSPEWEVIVDGLAFPEGMRWRDGHLYYSDIFGGVVQRVAPGGSPETLAEVDGLPSGLGFAPDGTILVVSMRTRSVMRLGPNGPELWADLADLTNGDCNDMLVDPLGRAYVGNFGYDYVGGAERQPAALVMVDVDGSARQVADGLWFPNGMVLTPDGNTLLVAETRGERITAFDVAADGSLSGRRVFATLPDRGPDGMGIDRDGGVWFGDPHTRQVVHVDADGEVQTTWEAPNEQTQACALGGPDGHTLFVACSPTADQHEATSRRPAKILSTRVAVGAPNG
ncbi:MAG: SMP-30/gluconolactonase/LRE family protein [Ilumatobacteraceae bacterium]|nr:SMP-30/gluconolactonase/LRE family protein [Ilumatobacteraceae bacterium]